MDIFDKGSCEADVSESCDDINSWQCYRTTTRRDCCKACEDHEVQPVVPGCEYGNRVDKCDTDNGRRCYINNFRRDCCGECQTYETSDPSCRYGDKVIHCNKNECTTYSKQRREDCCHTCVSNVAMTTRTPLPGSTDKSITNVTSETSGVPGWTVPVAACIGGILVLVIVIVVVIILRRKKKPDKSSPIDDKMYNEYKLTKRPPMAPPRHPSTERGWVDESKEMEYAYINPDIVDGPQSDSRRTGNDPLPAPPAEYMDLSDGHSVASGYGHNRNIDQTNHGEKNERATSNKYEQFPGSHAYVNQPDKQEHIIPKVTRIMCKN